MTLDFVDFHSGVPQVCPYTKFSPALAEWGMKGRPGMAAGWSGMAACSAGVCDDQISGALSDQAVLLHVSATSLPLPLGRQRNKPNQM